MAIKQSDFIRKKPITTPDTAGQVHQMLFSYTIAANMVAADIIEIGALPAMARVTSAKFAAENITIVTVDVGLMSGTYGSTDAARTVGAELFDDQAVATPAEAALLTLEAIAADDDHRSIGVKFSGDVAGAANKKVHIAIEYVL